MHSPETALTALVGREVYTTNGTFVGEVEDLRLNIETQSITGLGLAQVGHSDLCNDRELERSGVLLPYRSVRSVGDIILVHPSIEDAFPTTE